MELMLFHTHSGWRYIVLLLLTLTTLKMLVGWLGKQEWKGLDLLLVRVTGGSVHIQVLLGFILYILLKAWIVQGIHMWHMIPGLIGMALVAKAAGWAKREESAAEKFKWAFIGNAGALTVISFGVLYITMLR